MSRLALAKTDAAQMVGHNAMAGSAQRGEIAHLFVEEVCVGAVMDFERTTCAVVVADPAAEARGFKLGESGGVLAPTLACDVSDVVHCATYPLFRLHYVIEIGDRSRKRNKIDDKMTPKKVI